LQSPGSDKAENLFPKLANSSNMSIFSSPYGRNEQRKTQDQVYFYFDLLF